VRLTARPIAALAALAAIALGGCANTLQDQPVPHNILEEILASRFTVYWLGIQFQNLAITEAIKDPGGAVTFKYGNCLLGGGSTCVTPLRVVTSPDNSFLPGGPAKLQHVTLRGVPAVIAPGGRTVEIPTGGVVVDISAETPGLARAAAARMAAINAPGGPQMPLPAALPNTGFGQTPLAGQKPPPLRPIP
jgi:hypothetical protein